MRKRPSAKVEAEYKASRPGYLVFLVDGYDDVFSDMLDSERARLLEGINRVLEDMIGRGTGFLRRVASGRYIAVVEERQLEQFAKRGYDVLDKIRGPRPQREPFHLHRHRTRGPRPCGRLRTWPFRRWIWRRGAAATRPPR